MTEKKLLKEDENELVTDNTLDIETVESPDIDDRLLILANFLDTDPFMIEPTEYGYHSYKVVDGDHEGEEWMVLTDAEATDEQYENARNILEDIGFSDCGLDIKDYVSDDYCEEYMQEVIESDVGDMSDDDLIDELLDKEIISLEDEEWFKLKDDVNTEDDDFDEDDVDNYELLKDRDDLEQKLIDYKESDDLVSMFWDYGYGDWVEEDVRSSHGNFPYYIDEDSAVEDLVRYEDRGQSLSSYDGTEEELGSDDNGTVYYGYLMDK